MAGFERIVMATDFSSDCDVALHEAARLARESKGILYLVHAYELPPAAAVPYVPAGGYFESVASVRTAAEARLQDLLARVVLKGVDVRLLAVRGLPDQAIIDTAIREKADVIVMGTHGRRGAARLLLGSVAARVVASAPCPVLTIRSQGQSAAAATAV